ncbi:hypothetical protein Poli38472_006449 [Pythium oligandrum]|uniref:Fe2OG dioxygenase domain-containing protein n=1 Tax=Pythium oligandrum TaxID=41045 RepID=A0A8K1C4M4_PYTOL|nr:hypothetical protein Poli38472_006449 [Pythium oligandrum]|eukprot:TMW56439.1 hypothetical protein Poli38472_006449 [Pythium oligandrum]
MSDKKRSKEAQLLNDKYLEAARVEEIARHFQDKSGADTATWTDAKTQSQVIKHPFAACQLRDVFDGEFIRNVKKELLSLDFVERSNDLYWFYQSDDLKKIERPFLQRFRETVYSSEVRETIEKISGLELNDTVDLAGQRYPPHGYLLCHDDKLEGRRIAFIMYLVEEDWTEADGGELSLFGHDEKTRLPLEIEGAVRPKFNSLAFFEVTPTSYHQVSEILGNRERVSITGWFHGKAKNFARPEKPTRPLPNPLALDKFVRPEYLKNPKGIRAVFEEQGVAQLTDFLRPEVYAQLEAAVQQTTWKTVGTPNVGRWQQAEAEDAIFSTMTSVYASHEWITFLEAITSIPGRFLAANIQRYNHGTYSLLHDHCQEPNGLDVVLSIPSTKSWQDVWGGELVYVAGEDTLASFEPQPNTLMFAIRPEGSFRFMKYVNAKAEKEGFVLISAIYEDAGDEEDGEGAE